MITGTTMHTNMAINTNPKHTLPPVLPPVELTAPDISPYRQGNTGVDYITTFDSGKSGPHVMINAITHGNEICGAITLDRLFKMQVRPAHGKLTLSFANVAAFLRFDPTIPHTSRFVDEDFNRVWDPAALGGPRNSVELARARAMRPIIDQVDQLFDIHSMHDPHGPVMISGPLTKGIALAKQVGMPLHIVADSGHANGTRMRDYGGFGDPASAKNALLVECGQHWEHAAAHIAWQSTWRFLRVCHIMDRDLAEAQIESATVTASYALRVVRVTEAVVAHHPDFIFADGLRGLSVIAKQGTLIGHDGGRAITTPYDNCVLIMPTMVHVKPGLTVVRLGRIDG